MRKFKNWLIVIAGLWVTGSIIVGLSGFKIIDTEYGGLIGFAVIYIGVFLLGLSLTLFSRRIVAWSTKLYIERGIEHWRGIPVDNVGWNNFGVWMYRIIGALLMFPLVFFIIMKAIHFSESF